MKRKITNRLQAFLVFMLILPLLGYAQKGLITGTVTDEYGPLIGATITIAGTSTGSTSNMDGIYEITIEPGNYTIEARYIGFDAQLQDAIVEAGKEIVVDFNLQEGLLIDEVVVLGTRSTNRTNVKSAVPVDVINVEKLIAAAPQTNLNQLLHYTTPSFTSNTQTISDGTDHIDPASLRGLGPDQVLVLVNGKRRHTSSLVNVNGTFGRGSVATDLNALPAMAIGRIEVLRDGAAAQYGSDAIAGVINLNLKKEVNKLNLLLTTGANFTNGIGPFDGEQKNYDGESMDLGLNYGLPLGDKGGYINMTGQVNLRGATNRMLEFTGNVFNAYNAIENVASAAGADVSKLNEDDIRNYAQNVDHFSADFKNDIANTTDLAALQGLLGADVTAAELTARGQQRSDFNMRVGQSENRGGKMFVNAAIPLGQNLELYGFGGASYRDGQSGCFYRLPNQNRTTTSIYPNGTVPKINANITDQSIGGGIRGKIANWDLDFSTVSGSNKFLFRMTDTHNATLGASSPVAFDAGGHSFTQATSNFDVSQYFDNPRGLSGINVAFGAEYRLENYKVIPGTELSYGNYDVNGNLVNPTTPSDMLTTDFLGRNRPSGAQCFAGFLPSNNVDANRNSVGAYVDLEFDVTDDFYIGVAARTENYSDFGSTFNYKIAGRYTIGNNLNIRSAFSTGFRAPSLHQSHFSRTSTIFELVNGVSVPQERGTFSNTSRAAKLLGIPNLKQETSNNFSAGITAKLPGPGIKITLDGYLIDIDDRVVLTGSFVPGEDPELQAIFQQAGAQSATFFANAIDTRSRGIDAVISHSAIVGNDWILTNDLAATFSQNIWRRDITNDDLADDDDRVVIDGIKASKLLQEKGLVGTYFNQESRIYLEEGVPRIKVTLGNTLDLGRVSVYLRNSFFGATTEATNEAIFTEDLELLPDAEIDPYNTPKIITDLSASYSFTDNLSVTIGANNLLDIYPDVVDPAFTSSGRFIYSRRAPQFSFSGRHLFARVAFTLK